MLWFNFILGSNFYFLCFRYGNLMIMSLKPKKKKFEPRIKLNHNIYIDLACIMKYGAVRKFSPRTLQMA